MNTEPDIKPTPTETKPIAANTNTILLKKYNILFASDISDFLRTSLLSLIFDHRKHIR